MFTEEAGVNGCQFRIYEEIHQTFSNIIRMDKVIFYKINKLKTSGAHSANHLRSELRERAAANHLIKI